MTVLQFSQGLHWHQQQTVVFCASEITAMCTVAMDTFGVTHDIGSNSDVNCCISYELMSKRGLSFFFLNFRTEVCYAKWVYGR